MAKKYSQEFKHQAVQLVLEEGKTVARIMQELGLKSRTVKKYKATTNSRHNLPVYDNVLARKFSAQAPNQV